MNSISFIQQQGIDKAREVVRGAPDGCTHYRLLSCGARYTKNVSISKCYIWNGIMWRTCSAPNLVFTSDVIHSISDLKCLVESIDLIGKYHSIDHAKNHYNNMIDALNQYQYEKKDIEDLSKELEQAIANYELIYGVK